MTSDKRRLLRERYVRSFAAKIEQLEAIKALLGNPEFERSAVADARKACHHLVGSGGSYGFPTLSEVARRAERVEEQGLAGALTRVADELRALHRLHGESDHEAGSGG